MSAEITTQHNGSSLAIQDFTNEQIETLKNTIAKDCTTSELALFVAACRRTRLDPFAKQIYAMKMGGKLNVTVSIDGARIIAERSGEYEGQEGPFWCGADGVWKDAWLDAKPPAAAKVIVFRKGCKPMVGFARFAAYTSGQNLWAKMPEVMIAKCAEMLAFRKAFPNDLSGLYAPEEMDQATKGDETRAEFTAKASTVDDYMRQGDKPAIPPPSLSTQIALEMLAQIKDATALDAWKVEHKKQLAHLKKSEPAGYETVVAKGKELAAAFAAKACEACGATAGQHVPNCPEVAS